MHSTITNININIYLPSEQLRSFSFEAEQNGFSIVPEIIVRDNLINKMKSLCSHKVTVRIQFIICKNIYSFVRMCG